MGVSKGFSKGKNSFQFESLETRQLLSAGTVFYGDPGNPDANGPFCSISTSGANAQTIPAYADFQFYTNPSDVQTDGTNLFVSTGAPNIFPGAIMEFSPSGQVLNSDVISSYGSFSIDPARNSDFFVVNYSSSTATNSISEYTASGTLLHNSFISIPYENANSLSCYADGPYLLLLENNSKIAAYNISTGALVTSTFITPTATSTGKYFSLLVNSGDIYANSYAGTVDEFDAATGSVIKEDLISLPNFTYDTGINRSANLFNGSDIAIDGGELFIDAVPTQEGVGATLYEYSLQNETLNATVHLPDYSMGEASGLVVLGVTGAPLTNQLQFAASPESTQQNQSLAVTVDIDDPAGSVASGSDLPVTLSLSGGSTGAVLSGTTTVNAVDGVATFSDLSISQPGDGYVLTASSGAFTAGASTPFDVIAPSVLSPTFGKVKLPATNVVATPLGASLPVVLTNTGSLVHGKVTVNLYANTSPTFDGNQVLLKSVTNKNLVVKAGHKAVIGVSIPTLAASFTPGTYYLMAQVVDPLNHTASVATTQTISVADPNVAGTLAITAAQSPFVKRTLNSFVTINVTVTNAGNVPLRGQVLSITSSYINGAHPSPVTGTLALKHAFGRPLAVDGIRTFRLRYKATKATPGGLYALQADVSVAGNSAVVQGLTNLDLAGQTG